jgi:glycosyltransferase involved in cell wall biosynthesis
MVFFDDDTFIGGKACEYTGAYSFTDDDNTLIIYWDQWPEVKLIKENNVYMSNKLTLVECEVKPFRISFCTTCKNRLEHLKTSLENNLKYSRVYGNIIEHVILDYNSEDGLENWIKATYADDIDSGLIRYLKTTEPKYFHMAHAKNMAHVNATGDVLCNLDADNLIMPDFIPKILNTFSLNMNTILKPNSNLKGNGGRITVSKELFHKVRGYEESANGWGNEDQDFFNKCIINGGSPVLLGNAPCIAHGDKLRSLNYEDKRIRKTSNENYSKLSKLLKNGHFSSNCLTSYGKDAVLSDGYNNEKHIIGNLVYKFKSILILSDDAEPKDVRFFKTPNIFLMQLRGNKINGIGSHWFVIGEWMENENSILMDFYESGNKELLIKIDDVTYKSHKRKLIKE